MKFSRVLSSVTIFASLLCEGCGSWSSPPQPRKASVTPPAAAVPSESAASDGAIRFLEARVKNDPDDFIAHNKLAGYYLQRLRETGNLEYLKLTRQTVEASLRAMPAEQNAEGLAILAQVDFASHDFSSARDLARRLIKLESRRGYPFQILGDALLELGDYDQAAEAFREAVRRGAGDAGMAARLGREAFIRGRSAEARRHFIDAITLAEQGAPPSRETVAWCRCQLGEMEFNLGKYQEAEAAYSDALVTFPGYYRGLSGLGRTRAARGDVKDAIAQYEKAVRIVPDPATIAALGDLLALAGKHSEAEAQFALVEGIARLRTAAGSLYDRQLANFYADHDLRAADAYATAKREFKLRHDIYGADTLAWTAFKAGHFEEAREAIRNALRFNTEDARLHYHAGMIERASGNLAASRQHLRTALGISPQFDPRHAPLARKALSE